MLYQTPQSVWEERMKKIEGTRKELETKSSEYLEGMIKTYEDMQPMTTLTTLVGLDYRHKMNTGKRILLKRKLSKLSHEELSIKANSKPENPLKGFFQEFADFLGIFNAEYAEREIAKDLTGKRKGLPYVISD